MTRDQEIRLRYHVTKRLLILEGRLASTFTHSPADVLSFASVIPPPSLSCL